MAAEVDESAAAVALPKDYFYDVDELRRPIDPDVELPADALRLYHSFAFESGRRYNVHPMDEMTLMYAAGNVVHMYDIVTGKQSYLHGLDGRGIGAIAVHPSRKYFAVGEKGDWPNIYIYEYPSCKLYRVLRKGTEQAFTALAFTSTGTTLASVGAYPDYMLTVWDWLNEIVTLRNKAFSQEIYSVGFAPESEESLITSGMGHIRFWRMASTFTGLKLQGDIGKFGAVELSDVCAYATLPSGKVLSGTEGGRMLLWDGNLIEFEISRAGGAPCHLGNIELLKLEGDTLISGGHDGYVRTWAVAEIEAAEVSEEQPHLELEPLAEKHVGADAPTMIVNMVPAVAAAPLITPRAPDGAPLASAEPAPTRVWLVQDGCGALWRFDSEAVRSELMLEFHAGAIVGLACSPHDHVAATAGADGTLRLWDYLGKRLLFKIGFAAGASTLVWTPRAVDAEQNTLALGFADGTVRLVQRCVDAFKLLVALKPHTGAVTSLAYSPSGHQLATAGADGVVFFFGTDEESTPIGFAQVAPPGLAITALAWHADSRQLLVGIASGHVYALEAPDGDSDTSVTFELKLRCELAAVTPRALFDAQTAFLKPPEPVAAAAPAAAPAADGDAAAAAAAADAAAAEIDRSKNQAAEVEVAAAAVATLEWGTAADPTTGFTLTLGGAQLSGVEFSVGALADVAPSRCARKHSAPISARARSASGALELVGHTDGAVHVRRANADRAAPAALAWRGALHDGEKGIVSGVSASWDEAFVLTAAADGSLYVLEVLGLPAADAPAVEPPRQPNPPSLLRADEVLSLALDITDATAYSIEEAKLKSDQDAREAEAERRKAAMRAELAAIRAQFDALRDDNDALPESDRLTPTHLEIDQGLRAAAERARARTLADARAELAWDSERADKLLAKLRAAYLERIAVEHIELALFAPKAGQPPTVASIRTAKLSDWLSASVEQVHKLLALELARSGGLGAPAAAQRTTAAAELAARSFTLGATSAAEAAADADADAAARAADGADAPEGAVLARHSSFLGSEPSQQLGGGASRLGAPLGASFKMANDKVHKADELKARKALRAREWAAFLARKPDDKYQDPQDVHAIAVAERTLGNYPLKTDAEYVVPEAQRINAQKKRRQMVLLDESIHAIKMGYNERLLALRDLKQRIVDATHADDERLAQIAHALAEAHVPNRPSMLKAEIPEQRALVTQADVDAHARKLDEAARRAGGKSGFGGGGGGAPAAGAAAATNAAQLANGEGDEGGDDEPPAAAAAPSDFEVAKREYELHRLRSERAIILHRQARTRETFDAAASELMVERIKLVGDLKATDMRRLLLYRELQLLKEFEKRDTTLAKKLDTKRAEKADLAVRIAECQERLSAKRAEIERLLQRDVEIMAEFTAAVGENNKQADALHKIFRKKVKRSKKKAADAQVAGDDDNYDSDASDDDDDDDDDFDDDEEEVCPPGTDIVLYERVCELRLKRLDQEDVYAEFQKSIEQLKKDNDALIKKEKALDTVLLETDREIESFQTEKQRKLNELPVVVALHLSQLRHLNDEGKLPADLSECLVFAQDGLERLGRRIGELDEEKAELRKRQKDLRRKKDVLGKERKLKALKNSELEARAIDVQMLKFGQVVDLDALNTYTVNKSAEDLREKVMLLEQKQQRAMGSWDTRLKQAKADLIRSTQQSTAALERVAQLLATQAALETTLNKTQKAGRSISVPSSGQEEALKRSRLVHTVKLQSTEIDALKVEINMLRRKGGHVYSPAPPAPNPVEPY